VVSNGGDDLTDADLWSRVGNHDPAAFRLVFERHSEAVYNHCFRRTASWSSAQDLTSAVFLEAWRRRRDVRLSEGSILPWLLAVANNACRNRDRSLRRQRRLLAKLPAAMITPDLADEVAGRIDDERAMSRVLEVWSQLTAPEQDVFALCVWAQLSYAEAAVALAVPIGTVRSRLSRARDHLRALTVTSVIDVAGSPVRAIPQLERDGTRYE